jgi:hypothetical protein
MFGGDGPDCSWLAADFVGKDMSLFDRRNMNRPTPKGCPVVFSRPGSACGFNAVSIPDTSILCRSASVLSAEQSKGTTKRAPSSMSNATSPMYHGSSVKRTMREQQCVSRTDQPSALDATVSAPTHIGSPPLFAVHGSARDAVAALRASAPLLSGQLSHPVFHSVYGEAFRDGFDVAPEKFKANGFFQYTGDFRRSERHGKGAVTMGDGSSVVGHFVHGELTGKGVKTFSDGSTYMGDLLLGEAHGQGTYHGAADGEHYEGSFEYGQRSGEGVLQRLFQDEVYRGEFRGNVYHGTGSLEFRNRLSCKGQFAEGAPHGHCAVSYSRNQHTYDGPFLHGVEDGAKCLFVDADCGISYSGPMSAGTRVNIPNALVATDITIDTLGIESFFVGCQGPSPPASKCDRDREACCHADPYINIFPGQIVEVKVSLAHSEEVALRNLLAAARGTTASPPEEAAKEVKGAKKTSQAGPASGAARKATIAPKTPDVHHLISALASPPGKVLSDESGRSLFIRVCKAEPYRPPNAAQAPLAPPLPSNKKKSGAVSHSVSQQAQGETPLAPGLSAAISMRNVMSLAMSTTSMNFSQAFTMCHPQGPSGLLRSASMEAPDPLAVTRFAHSAMQSMYGQPSLKDLGEEVSFFDDSVPRQAIDRALGEFFAPKHIRNYSPSSASSTTPRKSGATNAQPQTPTESAPATPSLARSRLAIAVGKVRTAGSLLLGANDEGGNLSESHRASGRFESAVALNGSTRLCAKTAVNGTATFSITCLPNQPMGEYQIVVTAGGECCHSPGSDPVDGPPIAPLTIPIRVTQLDFQRQKVFVKILQSSTSSACKKFEDEDEDASFFTGHVPPVADGQQPLLDFNIPVPDADSSPLLVPV